jgi:hypothetical protein
MACGNTVELRYWAKCAEFVEAAGCLCPGSAPELEQAVRYVHLHGPRADKELAADLPARQAAGHLPHNLQFPGGQPGGYAVGRRRGLPSPSPAAQDSRS